MSLDVYYVVIACPNTGKATRAGHEFGDLEAFAKIGLVPEAVKCEHCYQWPIWRHEHACVERRASPVHEEPLEG